MSVNLPDKENVYPLFLKQNLIISNETPEVKPHCSNNTLESGTGGPSPTLASATLEYNGGQTRQAHSARPDTKVRTPDQCNVAHFFVRINHY
jgi:hypothetical protein